MAIGVTLVAVTAGAIVTAVAALSGSAPCSGSAVDPVLPASPADDVCYHLVRSLAERAGLLTAVLTAIFMLTVVGVSRLLGGAEEPTNSPDGIS